MTKDELIKGIIRLSEELDKSEEFDALLAIKEMQALVSRYDNEKQISIEDVNEKFRAKLQDSQEPFKEDDDEKFSFNHSIVFQSNEETATIHICEYLKQIGFKPKFHMTIEK